MTFRILLASLLGIALALPHPAYALRTQTDTAGLEDALHPSLAAGLEEASTEKIIDGQRVLIHLAAERRRGGWAAGTEVGDAVWQLSDEALEEVLSTVRRWAKVQPTDPILWLETVYDILRHPLANAADAVVTRWTPRLTAQMEVRIRGAVRHGILRIQILDNGRGIHPIVRGSLGQAPVTTKQRRVGIFGSEGRGVLIATARAKQCGWRFTVANRHGTQGAVASLVIPLNTPRRAAGPSATPATGLEERPAVQIVTITEMLREPLAFSDRGALLGLKTAGRESVALIRSEPNILMLPSLMHLVVDESLMAWASDLSPDSLITRIPAAMPWGNIIAALAEYGTAVRVVIRDHAVRPGPPPAHAPFATIVVDAAALDRVEIGVMRALFRSADALAGRTIDLTQGPIGHVTLDEQTYDMYA